MRRQTFHGERTGDADARVVGIRLVVEKFMVCLGGDGGIDGLLAGDARLPPFGVRGCSTGRPALSCLARDFPFLPCLTEGGVEPGAQGLQGLLPVLPDHVDLGIVGDGFQGDVRHALVDEALADVAMRGRFGGRALCDLPLLALSFGAVGEQIPGIARAHDARPRQRQGDTGGVDGDPAPPPLLGDSGRGSGAAGRVQHQIAGIRGHQDTACNNFCIGLYDIDFAFSK